MSRPLPIAVLVCVHQGQCMQRRRRGCVRGCGRGHQCIEEPGEGTSLTPGVPAPPPCQFFFCPPPPPAPTNTRPASRERRVSARCSLLERPRQRPGERRIPVGSRLELRLHLPQET